MVDRTCATCGDPHGRPRLPGTHLEASISHSGDVVAVAVTQAGPVGVDIEQVGTAGAVAVLTTTHVSFGVYDAAAILMAHSTTLDREPARVAPTAPVLPAIARQR